MFSHPAVRSLIAAKHAGTLAPLVGAGLSVGMPGNFPKWLDLPARLLEECDQHPLVWNSGADRDTLRARFLNQGPMPLTSLLRELDVLKQKLGVHYDDALTAIFRPLGGAPRPAHEAVLALGTQLVLTTNYDSLLEDAERPPRRAVYTWREADRALAEIKRGRRVFYKIHGNAESDSVVLTQDEYTRAHKDPAYRLVMNHLLIANSLLFIGYGMADPQDLDLFLAEHAAALQSGGSVHYALLRRGSDPQAEVDRQDRLRQQRIVVIPFGDFPELVPFLQDLARA